MKKIILTFIIILLVNYVYALDYGTLKINNVIIPSKETGEEQSSILYVYANGQRIAKEEDGNLFYFHNDHLGSPAVVTDAVGKVIERIDYMPFGKALDSSNEWIQYNSKELDEDTDLLYYGARYYDSSIGRFITADTVKGRLTDSQSMNLYIYTKNNPMNYIDLRGNAGEENNKQQKKYALFLFADIRVDYNGVFVSEIQEIINKVEEEGYNLDFEMVINKEQFIDAIRHSRERIDLLIIGAHGEPDRIVLGGKPVIENYKIREVTNPRYITTKDLYENMLAGSFKKTSRILSMSCSTASPECENNWATALSRAAGGVPVEGLTITYGTILTNDMHLTTQTGWFGGPFDKAAFYIKNKIRRIMSKGPIMWKDIPEPMPPPGNYIRTVKEGNYWDNYGNDGGRVYSGQGAGGVTPGN